MNKRLDKKAEAIEQAIEARGVHGVTVTLTASDDTTYLTGEVNNATEEAIAVEAAIAAGSERVEDDVHYPGAEANISHLGHKPAGPSGDPGVDILRGANLDGRTFDSAPNLGVKTGTPID